LAHRADVSKLLTRRRGHQILANDDAMGSGGWVACRTCTCRNRNRIRRTAPGGGDGSIRRWPTLPGPSIEQRPSPPARARRVIPRWYE
jgi:hypothetical protein